MKAKRKGYITRDEWRTGLKTLEANSLEKLVKALPALEREVFVLFLIQSFTMGYRE